MKPPDNVSPGRRKRRLRFNMAVTVLLSTLLTITTVAAPVSATENNDDVDESVEEVADALETVMEHVPALEAELNKTQVPVEDVDVNPTSGVIVSTDPSVIGDGVEIPVDADDPVEIPITGTETLEVAPTENEGTPDAQLLDDGSVVYVDAYTDTDVVVQAGVDGAARFITVINSDLGPTVFPFPIDTSDGSGIDFTIEEDGSVTVHSDGWPVAVVDVPWAYDANGVEVPTSYTTIGDTLQLNVDHSAVTAYPVTADPWFSKIGTALKCAGELAANFGPFIVTKIGKAAPKLAKLAKSSPKLLQALKVLGGSESAIKLVVGKLITKLPSIAKNRLGSTVKGLATKYDNASPAAKKSLTYVQATATGLIFDLLGIGNCVKLVKG